MNSTLLEKGESLINLTLQNISAINQSFSTEAEGGHGNKKH
jgi:hypothetical protein